MKLTLIILLTFQTYSAFANIQDISQTTKVQNKIAEIKSYTPITGTWIGQYYAKSMPKEKFEDESEVTTDEFLTNGVGIKLVISNKSGVKLFLKYNSKNDWSEVIGDIKINQDSLGFQIIVFREGSVWMERYWFSIVRTSDLTAKIITTRYVHNWYTDNNKQTEFYSIYSEGNITKQKNGVYFYSKCVAEDNKNNIKEAIEFCMKSRDAGNPAPLLLLGHVYLKDSQFKSNNKASKYYEEFAQSCSESSDYGFARLGRIALENSLYEDAYKWFYLCQNSVYAGCENVLNDTAVKLSKNKIEKAVSKAIKWREQNPKIECSK